MERGYSLNQVAELLGIKIRTVREWVHNGKLKARRIEGSRRYIVLESEVKRLRGELSNEE